MTVLGTEGDVMRCDYLEQTWGRRYEVTFEVGMPPMGYQVVHLYETDAADATGSTSGQKAPPVLENEHYRVDVEDDQLRILDKARGHMFADALRYEYQLDGATPTRSVRCLSTARGGDSSSTRHRTRAGTMRCGFVTASRSRRRTTAKTRDQLALRPSR